MLAELRRLMNSWRVALGAVSSLVLAGCVAYQLTPDGEVTSDVHRLRMMLSPEWIRVYDDRIGADIAFTRSGIDQDLVALSRVPYADLPNSDPTASASALGRLELGEDFLALVAQQLELPIFNVDVHQPTMLDGMPAIQLRLSYRGKLGERVTISYALVPVDDALVVVQCQTMPDASEPVDCRQILDSVVWSDRE